jgi:hypothetical protein
MAVTEGTQINITLCYTDLFKNPKALNVTPNIYIWNPDKRAINNDDLIFNTTNYTLSQNKS